MKLLNNSKAAGVVTFVATKPYISGVLALGLVASGYYGYNHFFASSGTTLYTLAQVKKETIISNVASTGQIIVKNQIDLKPQTSGNVVSLRVTVGQKVVRGQTLFTLDARSALISLKQAEASLASAKASYKKTQAGATEETILSSQASLDNSKLALTSAKQNAIAKIQDAYLEVNDIMNIQMASFFLNPNSVAPTLSISGYPLNNQTLQSKIESERAQIMVMLPAWKDSINKLTVDSDIASSLSDMTTKLNQISIHLDDMGTALSSGQSSVTSYKTTVSSARSSVSSLISSAITSKQSIDSAVSSLAQNQASFDLKKAPPTEDDLIIAQAQLTSAEASYLNAQQNYANTIVSAPFDAVVGAINVKVGDVASSGSSAITLITSKQLAELSLNEVDATKIKLGQKATLTFDAIEELSLAGTVAEVSPLGVVTQGVVTYTIKIAPDTEDDRIKSGMSVNANIITEVRPDVLAVPNAAVKSQGTNKYVETVDASMIKGTSTSLIQLPNPPTRKMITIGVSNDVSTEILDGVQEGDWVVVKTTTTAVASAQQAQSGLSLLGGNTRGAGGQARPATGGR